jgi:hypothetical protein
MGAGGSYLLDSFVSHWVVIELALHHKPEIALLSNYVGTLVSAGLCGIGGPSG